MKRRNKATSAENLLQLLRDKVDGDDRGAVVAPRSLIDAGTPMLPVASLEAASNATSITQVLMRKQCSPRGPIDIFEAWNNGIHMLPQSDNNPSPDDGVQKHGCAQQTPEETCPIRFQMGAEKPLGGNLDAERSADTQGVSSTSSGEGDVESSDDAWVTDRGHGSSRGVETSEGLPDPRVGRGKLPGGGINNGARCMTEAYRKVRRASSTRQQCKTYDSLVDPKLPREEIRRLRRTLSNRESARRARKRRNDQITALQSELADSRNRIVDLQKALDAALEAGRAAEAECRHLARRLGAASGHGPNDSPPSFPLGHNGLLTKSNPAPATSNHLQSPMQLLKMRQLVGGYDAVNSFLLTVYLIIRRDDKQAHCLLYVCRCR